MLGNIYLENTYIINVNNVKVNTTWFTKKNGTNCGINFYSYVNIFLIILLKTLVNIDILIKMSAIYKTYFRLII